MAIVSTLAAGAAALGLAGGAAMVGLPATADTPPVAAAVTADGNEQRRLRLDLACSRVPNAIQRTENLTERLAADAGTRGSLAWLEAKAAQAKEAGKGDVAAFLANRVEVRRDLAALLPGRLEMLQQAQELCDRREEGGA